MSLVEHGSSIKAKGEKKRFVNEQFLVLENQQMIFLGYKILSIYVYIYLYVYMYMYSINIYIEKLL